MSAHDFVKIKKELAISELFPDYQVSSSLYRGAKESDEKHIRETGSRLKRSFEGRLQRIQSCVKDKSMYFVSQATIVP